MWQTEDPTDTTPFPIPPTFSEPSSENRGLNGLRSSNGRLPSKTQIQIACLEDQSKYESFCTKKQIDSGLKDAVIGGFCEDFVFFCQNLRDDTVEKNRKKSALPVQFGFSIHV